MVNIVFYFSLLLGFLSSDWGQKNRIGQDTLTTTEEEELFRLINEYRQTRKLPEIPLSPALNKVAKAHAKDLMEHYTQNNRCNMHSWSKNGDWSDCCYTDNHKRANCMWDKPKEIAGYDSPGYEVAYWHSAVAMPGEALEVWKKSPGHHAVLANLGPFKQANWKAIGVGIYQQYAVVWFGELEDL